MARNEGDLTAITMGGTIFNYACRRQANSCVRRRIIMREPIAIPALREALELTRQRYPQLSLKLVKTKDEVREEYLDAPFAINDATACDDGPHALGRDTGGHLIAFAVEGRELSIDFFHAIADDIGMDRFIQALLLTYLRVAGAEPSDASGPTVACSGTFDQREGEDPSRRLLEQGRKKRPGWQPKRAFKVIGPKRGADEPDYAYTLKASLPDVLALGKRWDSTPTATISALFSRVLYRRYAASFPEVPPITAEVAVNLRNHFPTDTVRNFVGNAYLAYSSDSDRAHIGSVATEQTRALKMQNTPECQLAFFNHAMTMASRWLRDSSLPVYAKNWVHKHIAVRAMSGGMTYGISNIGKQQLPACLARHIDEYYSMIPSGLHAYLVSMRSQGDTLTLCITSKLRDSAEVAESFAQALRDNGIGCTIAAAEDFQYLRYIQNLAVTPAYRSRVDLSPAMDRVLAGTERASIALRALRVALYRRLA